MADPFTHPSSVEDTDLFRTTSPIHAAARRPRDRLTLPVADHPTSWILPGVTPTEYPTTALDPPSSAPSPSSSSATLAATPDEPDEPPAFNLTRTSTHAWPSTLSPPPPSKRRPTTAAFLAPRSAFRAFSATAVALQLPIACGGTHVRLRSFTIVACVAVLYIALSATLGVRPHRPHRTPVAPAPNAAPQPLPPPAPAAGAAPPLPALRRLPSFVNM
ncbi:hypothetical protein HDU96_002431, partial [Phlyctochytrium bullatum]